MKTFVKRDPIPVLLRNVTLASSRLFFRTFENYRLNIGTTSSVFCNFIDKQTNIVEISFSGTNPDLALSIHEKNLRSEKRCLIILVLRKIVKKTGVKIIKINYASKLISVNKQSEVFRIKILATIRDRIAAT